MLQMTSLSGWIVRLWRELGTMIITTSTLSSAVLLEMEALLLREKPTLRVVPNIFVVAPAMVLQ
jgi:hypothetical protein